MGLFSRQPNPNEEENQLEFDYGPKFPHDNISALLNGVAKKCKNCQRVTLLKWLNQEQLCPICEQDY